MGCCVVDDSRSSTGASGARPAGASVTPVGGSVGVVPVSRSSSRGFDTRPVAAADTRRGRREGWGRGGAGARKLTAATTAMAVWLLLGGLCPMLRVISTARGSPLRRGLTTPKRRQAWTCLWGCSPLLGRCGGVGAAGTAPALWVAPGQEDLARASGRGPRPPEPPAMRGLLYTASFNPRMANHTGCTQELTKKHANCPPGALEAPWARRRLGAAVGRGAAEREVVVQKGGEWAGEQGDALEGQNRQAQEA